jgi:hypothetical protein
MRLALALDRRVASLLIVSMICASCAHTTPNPVPVAQVGDDTKSCDGIANEMQQMVNAQTTAAGDRNSQIGANVALGIAGAFLIVPWFFMDVGNAATVEEKAAQARYLRLQQMQMDRKCPPVPEQAVVTVGPDGKPAVTKVSETMPAKAATSETLTPAQKLEYLDEMLKKGLITQAEYDAKKLEILKSM